MGQQVDISVGQLFAEHHLYAVGEQTTVKAYKTRFWQFANKRSNILVFNVGVGVVF